MHARTHMQKYAHMRTHTHTHTPRTHAHTHIYMSRLVIRLE